MSPRTRRALRLVNAVARLGFATLACLLLASVVLKAPPPSSLMALPALGAALLVLVRSARPALRADARSGLHAEIASVVAAISVIALRMVQRLIDAQAVTAMDWISLGALSYLVWRAVVTTRHIRRGTLPERPESGIAFARRSIREAMENGGSAPR